VRSFKYLFKVHFISFFSFFTIKMPNGASAMRARGVFMMKTLKKKSTLSI